MTKSKYIMMFLLVIVMILIPATMVNAYEDTWTYGEGENAVSVKKIVDNDNGSVTFTFTNINVEADKNYEWGVSSTENINDVEKWYTLVENYPDSKSANLALLSSNTDMRKILRSNIFVYLFIRDKNNAEQFLINKLKVDLTLPLLNAYKFQLSDNGKYFYVYEIYGIDNPNMLFQFEKITDENIINQYLEKKSAGKDYSEITSLKSFSDIPTSNWKKPDTWSYLDHATILSNDMPKEEGLYYLWVQSQDDSSKKIVGYTLFYGDANAPIVESIQVTDPKEGTYKSGQTVKIRAYFSENITGDSVPTLKIKFGTSPERSLTNGTIKNKYIEYSYDIQDSDVGQLATVSFEGGSIKDATGNSAKLSCPIISGYTIKANVEGTTTTQTDNQDKTENKTNGGSTTTTQTSGTSTSNGGSTTVNPTTSQQQTTQKSADSTTATKILPNTGEKTIIFVVVSVVIVAGVFAYFYFVKMKDVK